MLERMHMEMKATLQAQELEQSHTAMPLLKVAYLNFPGECRTEHESLTGSSWWHCVLVNNATNLRFKAHV